MNAENACTKIGCPAACCQNITLDLSHNEAERFLEGQHVNYINPRELQVSNLDEIPSIPAGFNVVQDPLDPDPAVHVYIRGFCPYVDQSSMDCSIYRQKKRPGICSEVNIGDYTCTIQRMRKGLAKALSRT